MSMRNYGIGLYGLVLTCEELDSLVKDNKETILGEDIDEDISTNDLFDLACDLGFFALSELDGVFSGLRQLNCTEKYFDLDYCFILELKKDTLFECYQDKQEIVDEVVNSLKDMGFVNVDIDFIKNNIGFIDGCYTG